LCADILKLETKLVSGFSLGTTGWDPKEIPARNPTTNWVLRYRRVALNTANPKVNGNQAAYIPMLRM
jgi:hypothetical protein